LLYTIRPVRSYRTRKRIASTRPPPRRFSNVARETCDGGPSHWNACRETCASRFTAPLVTRALWVKSARPPDEPDQQCRGDHSAADRECMQHAAVVPTPALAARGIERADGLVAVWTARYAHGCRCRTRDGVRPHSAVCSLQNFRFVCVIAHRRISADDGSHWSESPSANPLEGASNCSQSTIAARQILAN
jgi:hypothetical protein